MPKQSQENQRSGQKRKCSLLDEVLEHRMALYALAAGAALAAIPSVPGVAEAKVVATRNSTVMTLGSPNLNIDLDNDGTVDFILQDSITDIYRSCGSYGTCAVKRPRHRRLRPNGSSQSFSNLIAVGNVPSALAVGNANNQATALRKGQRIGDKDFFTRGAFMVFAQSGGSPSGPFLNVANRFLGVEFVINGQIHYGWIGFRSVQGFTATLAGWAYETVPNKIIQAGALSDDDDPSQTEALPANPQLPSVRSTALELLAMGHAAVAERQRRMETTVAAA